MKNVAVILLLMFANIAIAQQRQVSFSEIDERVKSIEPAPAPQLAYTLTKDYSADKEKLRSIFSWIAEHISYRVKKRYKNATRNSNYTSQLIFTDTTQWKSGNDMVAETVLLNQSAVCDGYARLFKTLCDYAGLRSVVITGFARGDYSRQLKLRCNHSWNAVYIDSSWQLLDVTWASGYTNYSGDEFIKRYDDTYFLTAPDHFIQDHFPDDLRWTLMEKPSLPAEFSKSPYKNKSFSKYKISSYLPATGIIEAAIGDTIQITMETADPLADSKMTSDTITAFDSSLQKINAAVAFLQPDSTDKNKLHYSFYVENNNTDWLSLMYNHDMVLRYRLKVKKEKEKPAIAENNKKNTIALPFYP